MILIVLQHGTPFIWNASDWLKLREEHRIVGNLIGCLPGKPRQEVFHGLPVSLLPEEVTLLVEKSLARVIDDSVLSKPPDDSLEEKCSTFKEINKLEQIECYEAQRKEQITQMIDKIIEGKRRKLSGLSSKNKKMVKSEDGRKDEQSQMEVEIDRDEILKNELEKASTNPSYPLLVQTFTCDPWLDSPGVTVEWDFPRSSKEKLKYKTFKDLWEKGYYITEGNKFGVDYLVYPGDPVKFHAQFLVVCLEYEDRLTSSDFIAYARLGSISRKTLVISSDVPDSQEILYQSIKWTEQN